MFSSALWHMRAAVSRKAGHAHEAAAGNLVFSSKAESKCHVKRG
jgi:hypothetical protein